MMDGKRNDEANRLICKHEPGTGMLFVYFFYQEIFLSLGNCAKMFQDDKQDGI